MSAAVDWEVDKSKFGAGPWMDEPDRVEFRAHGLPCILLRQKNLGHWCGYVGVPPSHPWHRKGYSDDAVNVDVHGGLTYAEKCNGPICHVPSPGESDDIWWFGFDCAHMGDVSPGLEALRGNSCYSPSSLGESYKDVNYLRYETARLAEQLAGVA